MSQVTIRPSVQADVKEFLRIEKENFSDPWSRAVFLATLINPRYINLTAILKNDVANVATADVGSGTYPTDEIARDEIAVDEIVGFLCLAVIADEGHIDNVSVSKTCRRQGIGERMLSEAMRLGAEKGVTSFTLEVRTGNASARALYEKSGFVCEGIRKKYYDHPAEDAAIYWKRESL